MKVFISHSKEDNIVAYRILRMLDENRIPKWIDLEQLGLDSSINEKINEGIETSDYFLLIWSKNAKASKYVSKECNAVITPDYENIKKIIIRLDDTKLPPLLADKRYHSVNEENLESTLLEIISEMKSSDDESDEFEEFDAYLDGNFGFVKIADYTYATSYAFKSIDLNQYKQDYLDWSEK